MLDANKLKRVVTADGSHTLHHSGLDETYHSRHGAIREAEHVFIEAGLHYILGNQPTKTVINILEFGFGTGLNALLTAVRAPAGINIVYHTLEKYPLPSCITRQINYGTLLQREDLLARLHDCPWEEEVRISEYFLFKKIQSDFRIFQGEDHTYDLVYYDAFAPSRQPELWDTALMSHCYALLGPRGVWVTYAASGRVRRNLLAAGFRVEKLPGPPGKREMLRAIKTIRPS